MMTIATRAFGVLGEQREQKEFMLVLSVLDCCIRDEAAALADLLTWFKSEYILDPYFRAIFTRLLDVQRRGEPLVPSVVSKGLHGCGKEFSRTVTDVGNLILDCTNQGAHLRYYAADVYQEHRRRSAAADIAEAADAMAGADDPDRILEQLPEIACKYAPLPMNRTIENDRVMQEIIAKWEGKRDNDYLRFGINILDSRVDGLPPGALVTVGARTSCGKSVFLGQTALHCANHHHRAVLFFSLEMAQGELYERWACMLSRQPIKGGQTRPLVGGLGRVDLLVRQQLLHVFMGARTVEQIAAEATAFAARCNLGLICVDYLQAVVPTRNRSEGREQQVAHIAAALKHLASQCGVPVLTASQLNKEGQDTPRLSSIRESEAIANYSNIVLLLAPASPHGDAVKIDINIAKYRDGATDVVTALWERPLFTIRDLEAHDRPN